MPRLPSPSTVADRRHVLVLGLAFFAAGAYLVWDATDRQGRGLPWPFGAVMPF